MLNVVIQAILVKITAPEPRVTGWPRPIYRSSIKEARPILEEGHPMRNVTTIGVDLAKNTFQLHGVDAHGKIVLRRTLRRDQVVTFFANLPECLVGMEACASPAYWARAIEECGHTVRRIHPRFVKPYLMADKKAKTQHSCH